MMFHKRKMRQLLKYFILFFYFVKLKTYRELLQKKSLQQKKTNVFTSLSTLFFLFWTALFHKTSAKRMQRRSVERRKKNMRTIYTRAASSLVIEFAILNPSVNVRSFSTQKCTEYKPIYMDDITKTHHQNLLLLLFQVQSDCTHNAKKWQQ